MAIDKESSGLPEIDPHRKTTKVNLAMIVAIGLFFAVVYVAVYFFHRHSGETRSNSAAPTQTAPARTP